MPFFHALRRQRFRVYLFVFHVEYTFPLFTQALNRSWCASTKHPDGAESRQTFRHVCFSPSCRVWSKWSNKLFSPCEIYSLSLCVVELPSELQHPSQLLTSFRHFLLHTGPPRKQKIKKDELIQSKMQRFFQSYKDMLIRIFLKMAFIILKTVKI